MPHPSEGRTGTSGQNDDAGPVPAPVHSAVRHGPAETAGRRPLALRALATICFTMLLCALLGGASASELGRGSSAFHRGDYAVAARALRPLAEAGNVRAQTMMGFMCWTGRGVPQDYAVATAWYSLAAERGEISAQYSLGLAFAMGRGVPRDGVSAYKWLVLATARAPALLRDKFARIRDAVASRLSPAQVALGQAEATRWSERAPGWSSEPTPD